MTKTIGTFKETIDILKGNDLFAKKKYGQNFLVDQNVLTRIVEAAEINKEVNVIEIGPGIGSLTEHLIDNANKVIAYEIDDKLIPILTETFSDKDYFTLIHQDVLEADIEADIKKYFDDKPIYVVANLPYYITTPIIMHLLEDVKGLSKYVVMVQNEVADRICANKGGKDYNNLTITIKYRAESKKAMFVSRNVFYPKPNVDSAIVIIDLYKEPKYIVPDEKRFLKLIRESFANRRKTLVNNLCQAYGFNKQDLASKLEEAGFNPMARSEELAIEDFVKLDSILF